MIPITSLLPSQRPVVGIDIGKRKHAAAGVMTDGRDFGKPLPFKNNRAGIDLLEKKILAPLNAEGPVLVGIEATGHYWMCLYFELTRRGYECVVLNPIETTKKQRRRIRKTKTDKIDARGIARFIREGDFGRSRIPDVATFELRHLIRHRWRLQGLVGQLQASAESLVDVLFPEFTTVFSSPWLVSARALIRDVGASPTAILESPKTTRELVRKASRGKISDAQIDRLLECASATIGIRRAEARLDTLLQSSLTLFESIEQQITAIDEHLGVLVAALQSPLGTIGLSTHIIATIHAECDPASDFSNARQLVAYAGLDPTVFESGEPGRRSGRISKRGSRRLRQALYLSSMGLIRRKGVFQDTYRRARKVRKHHTEALVAVAAQLARIVFRMLRDNQDFDPEHKPRLM